MKGIRAICLFEKIKSEENLEDSKKILIFATDKRYNDEYNYFTSHGRI